MAFIKLPVRQITIDIESRTITSNLHEDIISEECDAAMSAIESLVLAQACAGIEIVKTPQYLEALEATIQSIINDYEKDQPPNVFIR